MRVERLVPCPPKDVWRALIEHAELGARGAVLRLGPAGNGFVANITVYRSKKILECVRGREVLRWELHPQREMTRVVFISLSANAIKTHMRHSTRTASIEQETSNGCR